MSQHRKARGYATQRIVADYLRTHGWPHAHAIGAGEAGDDIQGTLDIAVEVKARTGFDPLAAIRQMQARRRPGALPFAVLRMNGTGEATIDDWPVVIRLADLVAVLREAGYGEPLVPICTNCGEETGEPDRTLCRNCVRRYVAESQVGR